MGTGCLACGYGVTNKRARRYSPFARASAHSTLFPFLSPTLVRWIPRALFVIGAAAIIPAWSKPWLLQSLGVIFSGFCVLSAGALGSDLSHSRPLAKVLPLFVPLLLAALLWMASALVPHPSAMIVLAALCGIALLTQALLAQVYGRDPLSRTSLGVLCILLAALIARHIMLHLPT